MPSQNLNEIKSFLAENDSAVLSTQSLEMPGYPFGSLVAYALDAGGCPLVQLSALAEHTKNIAVNPKICLTIADIKKGDVQNSRRLTIVADAVKLSSDLEDIKERYYSRFPSAREYGEKLDFSFYKLKPLKIRFIGGFGRIFSVEPAELGR